MITEQKELLEKANESLQAAKTLYDQGFYSFAASRAYYTMFYLAEAMLLSEGLSFSKHSAVHSAFGEKLIKTGKVAPKYHRYLISGMEVRHGADYDTISLTAEESITQISRAEEFQEMAEKHLKQSDS